MILYEVTTNFHLLCACSHRINYYKDENCVLLISKLLRNSLYNFSNLYNVFNYIIEYDHTILFDNNGFYARENNDYIESIFENAKVNIHSIKEINLLGAQFRFGAYLVEHNISFVFWEEATGLLSREKILRDNESAFPVKQKYCEEKGLYNGHNPNVTKRICNFNAQINGFYDPLASHFDLQNELDSLTETEKKLILKTYTNVGTIEVPKDYNILFLTQHFANLSILSFEDQALCYQLIIDYFFENKKIMFKPHPDDLMYYSILFPESFIIKQKFPSEFLPYVFSKRPDTIATISSTGIFNLNKFFKNTFYLGFIFQKNFKCIHRYYAATLLTMFLHYKESEVQYVGVNETLVSNLYRMLNDNTQNQVKNFENSLIYIIDDSYDDNLVNGNKLCIEKICNCESAIFLNSSTNFLSFIRENKLSINCFVPIVINKKCVKKSDFYSDENNEVIYFFSNNTRLLKMVKEFKYDKELHYSGLQIFVEKLTEEQRQIKVLEGILAATEEALLYANQENERK